LRDRFDDAIEEHIDAVNENRAHGRDDTLVAAILTRPGARIKRPIVRRTETRE
jgi:arsenate reductase-like glutaredoxin family protein